MIKVGSQVSTANRRALLSADFAANVLGSIEARGSPPAMWSGSLMLKPDWRQTVSCVFDYLAARGLVTRNPLPAELAAHPKG